MSRRRSPKAAMWLADWIVAVLLTGLALFLHFQFLTHAGALWRDEVNSVELASMPSLSSLNASIQYDGFPLLSTLLLRGWVAAGWGGSDGGLRVFGFIVGVAVLGAVWLAVRLLRCPTPVVSLALVGLNPLVVQTTDSIRPYGLGIALIVATLGVMWKVIESPTPWRFVGAGILATLSVQCMYQNAFLLFGICLAGAVVAFRRSDGKSAVAIGMVGAAAAVSLVPYASSIKAAQSWNVVNQSPIGIKQLLSVFGNALGGGGAESAWVWIALLAVCCGLAIRAQRSQARPDGANTRRNLALFSATVMVAAAAAFMIALKATSLPTQTWYYVPLMVAVAPMLDAGVWAGAATTVRRLTRLGLVVVIAGTAVTPALRLVRERRTNVDLVASLVERRAAQGDVIVVYPWYCGVSFRRYYHGGVGWTTIPPVEDLRIHRYDLLKAAMARSNPIEPVLERMADALKSGYRVWLVGGLPPLSGAAPPPALPPAPNAPAGWRNLPYLITWGQQATHFLQSHALRAETLPTSTDGLSNPLETLSVVVVSGWH